MSDGLPVIDARLAAGDGWSLSRGRDAVTGAARMLVTLASADPAEVRRRLAVAGSVGGGHLVEVVNAVALADGAVAIVLPTPAGPSLAELRRRVRLSAAQIVTLVRPLAAALGEMDRRGVTVVVTPETVWLASDGRPVLLPVVVAEHGRSAGGVTALATLAAELLDPQSPHATAVAATLESAVRGDLDAATLSRAMAHAAPAQPIHAVRPASGLPLRSRGARSSIAIVAVVAAAICLGALSGRGGGSATVLAAPLVGPSATTAPVLPSWSSVLARLERMRSRAFATGDVELLDQVYAPGSPTGAADHRLLLGLADRGRRAAGLQAFVESVAVLSPSTARITLRVTDALTTYDVVDRSGHVVRHGHGRPARQWRVVLVRTGSAWRIWAVVPDG